MIYAILKKLVLRKDVLENNSKPKNRILEFTENKFFLENTNNSDSVKY